MTRIPSHEINLLPKEKARSLFQTYYVRLATLTLVLISGAIAIGGILLAPSYILASRAADAGERYLAALEETVGVRERAGVSDDVRLLAERLRVLDQEARSESFVPLFEAALGSLPPSIRVSGISFSKGADAIQVSIVGTAATRTALISFSNRLQQSGTFDGVTIPVSQLAIDQNIPFSITATYKSAP